MVSSLSAADICEYCLIRCAISQGTHIELSGRASSNRKGELDNDAHSGFADFCIAIDHTLRMPGVSRCIHLQLYDTAAKGDIC